MVLGRHHEREQPGVVPADEEDGTIFALAVIVLIWHPRPHHFTRIRNTVEVGGVDRANRSRVVTRIGAVARETLPTRTAPRWSAISRAARSRLRAGPCKHRHRQCGGGGNTQVSRFHENDSASLDDAGRRGGDLGWGVVGRHACCDD